MEQYVKYLRKSRFDRDYAELSIEETLKRHEAILDKLARERGYHIAKSYYEVVSGESIASRPEIQKMLEEVSRGIYSGVLVVDVERLARGNGADQAYISQVFQYSGTKIITPLKTYDPSNEYDEEYFEFGLFMSRREYKTINRRLIRGRDSSAAEGKYINSIAPYGYQRVKLPSEKGFTLEPHPQEAEVIKKIFDMYLHNMGTKVIANYLNDCRIPTRHGDLWSYCTISNIVTNPIYMGKIRRGWSRQIKRIENGVVKKHIKREKNLENYNIFDGLHPALVSEEDFMLAQEIRKNRQPLAKVKNEFELQNSFAGLLFCANCGKRIARTVGSKAKGALARFRCVNSRNCHTRTADYYVVEKEIIKALKKWLDGYKVKIDSTDFSEDIAECEARLKNLDREEAELTAQMENAYTLVEKGIYSLDLFCQRRDKLSSALAEVKEKQIALQQTLSDLEQGAVPYQSIVPQTEALLASYSEMSKQEQNDILKTILYRIDYNREASGEIIIDLYPRLSKLK